MNEIKRFDLDTDYACDEEGNESPFDSFGEDENGDYCLYSDYAELEVKLDAAIRLNAELREQSEEVYAAGYNHGHLNTVDGIAYAPGTKDEFYSLALQIMSEVDTPTSDSLTIDAYGQHTQGERE